MRARVAERSKAMDLGSILAGVQGFESLPSHVLVFLAPAAGNQSLLLTPRDNGKIFSGSGSLTPVMDIYILRHGKAGIADHGSADDHMRHLTPRGVEEIKVIGEWIRERAIDFSVIASSPLARARETASIVSGILSGSENVQMWEELTPGVPPGAVVQKIKRLTPGSCILLVGHEPQLSSLISLLVCNCPYCDITMKKGGIARIHLEEGLVSGTLLWLLPPGLIRDLVSDGKG